MDSNPRPPGERERSFLERVYWGLGSALVAWSIMALMCILRRRLSDIPIFGKVEPSEAIIFTQGAFCLLLPLLLGTVATFRREAARRGWRTRFPGVPEGDWDVPDIFGWLRVVVFLVLVVLPVATMGLCYRRMVDRLEIFALWADHQPALKGGAIFSPPPRGPQGQSYDWCWRGEEIKPEKGEEAARITAFPLWQPWIYRLVFYGGAAVTLWFLFVPAGKLHQAMSRGRMKRPNAPRGSLRVPGRSPR